MRRSVVLSAVAALLASLGVVLAGVVLPTGELAVGRPPVRAAARTDPAASVLGAWDRRRAAAYEIGSVRALRSLYVAGSRAGRADLRLLGGYLARGFVVRGMRMQLLAVSVLDRDETTWRLRVTDRLTGAVAVGGRGEVALPADAPSTRTVTLVRGRYARWTVSEVSSG